ncbi:sugar ABC transporter permease [Jiangella ureilytica]|uniref:Sugar ABC transporter permease n=1 Tax=Jiangella ureilytica TaxID=2530374 RepID=A0A4R4RG20_9ACTN|nr:sugar ABC transporter permease [Jiangella ureilytica]TDC47442.1 sugar ABC transporter permease [Jiangella ureilytica]
MSAAVETTPAPASRTPRWWRTRRGEQRLVGYAFLLPDLLGLAVFVALPILGAFYISFHDWTGIGAREWTGTANYETLLQDQAFRDSLKITAVYTVTFVPLLFVLSLALALLVNRGLALSGFFRSAYFAPFMVSLVVASVVWGFMLQDPGGVLNAILGLFGIEPQPWLGSTRLAMVSVILVTLWQGVGYSMIIFLTGLQDIPKVYYEAAVVDGAGAWRRFRGITLPLLRPTSVFVLLITFISALQLFDPIYVLTQGGPAGATRTTVVYIYETAFQFLQLGYASALSVALFVIILVFSLLQLRIFRHESYD